MDKAYVKSYTNNSISTIEFYHPQSNSLPASLLNQLAQTIQAEGQNPASNVIVLQSVGEKAFCAGASFDELTQIKNEQDGQQFFTGFAHVINSMRKCPKFIIGRIQGKCVGGGVGLAASVDYAIATTNAQIKLSELAVGIGPFVVGPAVERKMGTAAFSALAIDATNWRNAEWAHQNNLFAELHSTIQEMDASINKLATQLSLSSPDAMQQMKKIFWNGTDYWDELLLQRAAISGSLVLSDFTKNAIAKFKAK
jgi:methylglutaconyl-CoA hydratase